MTNIQYPKYDAQIHRQVPATIAGIREAESLVEEMKSDYLRQHGWEYSSGNNPACFWLWTKIYNSKPLMAGTEVAIRLETAISGEDEG